MADVASQTLNQYVGTDKVGNPTTIVAADMTTACQVYAAQENGDPITMQCTKQNIKCVLPDIYVSFTTEVTDPTGVAVTAGCKATPNAYTLLAGSKQLFTAIPVEGWAFDHWEIDGVEVTGDEASKETAMLTIPASPAPIKISAAFRTHVG